MCSSFKEENLNLHQKVLRKNLTEEPEKLKRSKLLKVKIEKSEITALTLQPH